jgi:hypothetical protein
MNRWRLIALFCCLGLIVACLYVAYLSITYPNRSPRVASVFDVLCPPSFLTLVYLDVPSATTAQYAVVWFFIAMLNAGLYGVVAALVIKLVGMLPPSNRQRQTL